MFNALLLLPYDVCVVLTFTCTITFYPSIQMHHAVSSSPYVGRKVN